MSTRPTRTRAVSPAARVFSRLEADDALLPGETSAVRKSGALFLALLVLGAVPLFWAANAAGVIGDLPAAIAKGSNSGPGGGDGDEDNSGPGSGDDDTATGQAQRLGTNDTSAHGNSTRGTTNDADTRTRTRGGTNDTSANGNSTRGTTNDNDTRTNSNTHTRTRGQTQTRTRTRTGS